MKPYTKSTVVAKGEEVSYNGKVYRAKRNTLGVSPEDATIWEEVSEDLKETTFKPWALYSQGDKVILQGKTYIALHDNYTDCVAGNPVWQEVIPPKPIPEPEPVQLELEVKPKLPEKEIVYVERPVVVERVVKEIVRPPLSSFWK